MRNSNGSKAKRLRLGIWLSASLVVALSVGSLAVQSYRTASPNKVDAGIPNPGSPSTKLIPTTTVSAKPAMTAPTTFLGKDGVKSSWVIAQNKLPGTTAWRITGNSTTGVISGFANRTYARTGQSVTLYVSTNAKAFQVYAYRMGYYGGTGAHLIWKSTNLAGSEQPSCTVARPTNMVSCANWNPSLEVQMTSAFVQGDYLFKLVGDSNQQSYVPLTVWNPTSKAAYVIKNDVLTWQAWNPYGGYDFYAGIGNCPSDHYPLCSRARVVSFDRPYAYGGGAADFLGNEYPLVYWAEKHGLDVTYWTDQTVVAHPSLLANHKALLSLGHDECWSLRERKAVESANHSNGLNVVFFGASAMLRHVRLQSSPLGGLREVVDYRNSFKDPLYGTANPLEVTGNTWSSPPASWPESNFVGESYAGYLLNGTYPVNFIVSDASSWIFSGTGLRNGEVIPSVIASDFDSFEANNPHPQNLEILGHSLLPSKDVQTIIPPKLGVYSDMTYYTDAKSGGGVFDSGTNNWISSLSSCPSSASCPSAMVRKVTGNLLHLFGLGPAGKAEPSVANWQHL